MTGRNDSHNATTTWLSNKHLTKFILVLFAVFAAPTAGFAATPGVQTASLTPSGDIFREPELPTVLSRRDAARYRIITTLQDEGRWAAADGEIAALEDPLLLGHVLAQRYLHRAYKAKFPELQDWLAGYADQPAARAIHALAYKRGPTGAPAPAKPEG